MRKALSILIPATFLLVLSACSKSGSSGPRGLNGTWLFLGMTGQSQTNTTQAGVTTKASVYYVTKGNAGIMIFTNDSILVSGLGFSVDTAYTAYFYHNSVLYDSSKQPIHYFIPPTSNRVKYIVAGSDSLYLPSGGLLSSLDSTSRGEGCRYLLKGDSLSITSQVVDTSGGGLSIMNTTIRLKRQ